MRWRRGVCHPGDLANIHNNCKGSTHDSIARALALSSILALAALAGCSTTSGTGPNVTRSGFDGARVVAINGHGNACKGMLCTGLGAHWNPRPRPTRSSSSTCSTT